MRWNSINVSDAPLGSARTRFLRPALLAAVAVGVALALSTSDTRALRADGDGPKACSNRTLRGDYGFAIEGAIVLPGPAKNLLLRGLVMQHFDGRGNSRGVDFITLNGVPEGSDWRPITGTYEVNPDCTGTAEIHPPDDGPSVKLRILVVDAGRQVMEIVEGNAVGSLGTRVR
jgi:hypothetical protein